MIYLLDANVVIDFDQAGALSALVRQSVVDVQVVEQVYVELCTPLDDDPSHRRSEKQRRAKLLKSRFSTPIEILPGTHAAQVMRHLQSRKTSNNPAKDRGEAASIAAASVDRELCFVAEDTGAVRYALGELFDSGERVQRLAPFVRVLYERGAIDRAAVSGLGGLKKIREYPPSWWATWLASI